MGGYKGILWGFYRGLYGDSIGFRGLGFRG